MRRKKAITFRVVGGLFIACGLACGWFWFHRIGPIRRCWDSAWMELHSPKAIWLETERRIRRTGWQHDDFAMVGRYGDKSWAAWIVEKAEAGEEICACGSIGHKDAALEVITNQDPAGDKSREKRRQWLQWWERNGEKTQEEWIRDGFAQYGVVLQTPLTTNNIISLLAILGSTNNESALPSRLGYNAMRWLRDSDVNPLTFTLAWLTPTNSETLFRGLIRFASASAFEPKSDGIGVLNLGAPPVPTGETAGSAFVRRFKPGVIAGIPVLLGAGLSLLIASFRTPRSFPLPVPAIAGRPAKRRVLAALGIVALLLLLPLLRWVWVAIWPVHRGLPVMLWVDRIEFSGFAYHCDPAVEALGEIEAARLVPALCRILRTRSLPDWVSIPIAGGNRDSVQARAAFMLGEIGPSAERAVDGLLAALTSGDDAVRERAAEALGKIQGRPEVCVPALAGLLSDDRQPVRLCAIEAIGRFGPKAQPYYDKWKSALDDEDGSVSRTAAGALISARIGATETCRRLVMQLYHADPWVQEVAAWRLGRMGIAAREAVPRLRQLLGHDKEDVRVASAIALARIDPSLREEAVPLIVEAARLQEMSAGVDWAKALFEIAPETYPLMPVLLGLTGSTNVHHRITGVEEILEIDAAWGSNAIPILIGALASNDEWAQCRAADQLRRIGPPAGAAIPALNALSDHEDPDVRGMARKALNAITAEAPGRPWSP